ncbi:MAG TPA: AMP-binding protein [Mycobacteriales bacterium]|nr:AMP-binding protein [Mycobacteriales bacterium]
MVDLAMIGGKLQTLVTLTRAGMLNPLRPDQVVSTAQAMKLYGRNAAGAIAAAAKRFPDAPAIVDERGRISFAQLDASTNGIARGLADLGVDHTTTVGILCRNHRGFVQAAVAATKLGSRALCLNTDFAGPQLAAVIASEGVTALVHDEEFAPRVTAADFDGPRVLAWVDADTQNASLDTLAAGHAQGPLPRPPDHGRVGILTSGTTGTPKGATRGATGLDPLAAMLERIPLHTRGTTVLPAPMFHVWGFAHFTLATALSSTLVLNRRFDAQWSLRAVEENRADLLAVVPVMLARILDAYDAAERKPSHASLKAIMVGGSQLGGTLASRTLQTLGDKLYNLYGSTEVAIGSVATPADLRAAPNTVGRAVRGVSLALLDADRKPVPPGEVGAIFVGSEMVFEGYTGGGGKEIVDGRAATGDVGHLDEAGRLFIDGRDDDMIVSGGENVFPAEVEDLLAAHPDITEASVVGVPDDEFGQRLAAFVVPRGGADLSEEQVREHVRGNLARYKVPRDVTFLEALPRNPAGKVLKRELTGR